MYFSWASGEVLSSCCTQRKRSTRVSTRTSSSSRTSAAMAGAARPAASSRGRPELPGPLCQAGAPLPHGGHRHLLPGRASRRPPRVRRLLQGGAARRGFFPGRERGSFPRAASRRLRPPRGSTSPPLARLPAGRKLCSLRPGLPRALRARPLPGPGASLRGPGNTPTPALCCAHRRAGPDPPASHALPRPPPCTPSAASRLRSAPGPPWKAHPAPRRPVRLLCAAREGRGPRAGPPRASRCPCKDPRSGAAGQEGAGPACQLSSSAPPSLPWVRSRLSLLARAC